LKGEEAYSHLARVLEREASGARFLILTHQSPDPDALGALVGVRYLLERGFGRAAEVATRGRIQRAENVAMVRELGLRFADYATLDHSAFSGTLLVDTQPGFGHTEVPDDIPLLAVFDHHEADAKGPPVQVPHWDVRPEVGATSSLVYEYVRESKIELDTHAATSLFCGVRFDTADLAHAVGALDEEAYNATLRRADKAQLARIQRPPLPPDYYRELGQALRHAKRYGSLVVALLGEVTNPGTIAEMADFFLRMENCHWSLCGGANEGTYYVSLRTQHRPAYPLLARILRGEGSFGGHGSIAGGQVQLGSEGSGDDELRRLERRIRARALHLLETLDGFGPEEMEGRPIA
jgi:nanoRNase/pAp phosphatase (c-di-AMP/oligoRNAs hydrolase)